MKRPEYVRGALFSSHAHYWAYKTGQCAAAGEHTRVYSAIVWYKRRRKVMHD